MKSAKIIVILNFFLIFKTIIGQLPSNCGCYLADDPTDAAGCSTRGCSIGNNIFCNNYFDTSPYRYATLADTSQSATDYASYRGCNCPGSNSTATYNGYYGTSANHYGYSYTNCTDYGGNARNTDGHIPADIDTATDCCNFCCNRNDPYPSSLPPECYNPDGSSCEWYKNCLEKKYPCQSDPDDYAIKYATRYCNQYTKNYNNFSGYGQKWVGAVRKCLQIKLVPLLNQSASSVTCKQIKVKALASHTPCYVEPDPDALGISFCYLSLDDTLLVFDTIKSSFLEETLASIEGLIITILRCGVKPWIDIFRVLRLYVSTKNNALISSIAEPFREDDDLAKFTADGIAEIESWDPKRIRYFSYSADTSMVLTKIHDQQITVEMLLFDKFAWDNLDNTSSTNVTQSYLNQTIDHLIQSVQQGKLEIKTTNSRLYVKQMDKCLDSNCNETDGNPAIAPPYNFAIHSVNINISIIMGLISVLLLILS